ncbi:DUF6580 family putative transport protein [Sulfuriroseicoccus oceanibius]|uniref:Uncharacterized protein n=1 Tax=Sulfuriroseicoccus oceanibius TaxID=2707525 RepID=A0A6B3LE69_9BACT|nr:DUF6580 family putative transport protein [Sulfuriroseicoccus oceanibius]QQL45359.1 hypothetical protein G3M56_001855 [Sulfuriroseicoccus oceanibius]
MSSSTSSDQRAALIASVALFFSIIALRLVFATTGSSLMGYSPMIAMVLCAAYFFRKPVQWLVPAAAYLISDIWITVGIYEHSFSIVTPLVFVAFYIGLVAFSRRMGNRMTRLLPALFATATGALAFYLIANTLSWVGNPVYDKSLAGWIQAQTTGDPAFAPTWTFFRASLVGNLLFTAAFIPLAHRKSQRVQAADPVCSVNQH